MSSRDPLQTRVPDLRWPGESSGQGWWSNVYRALGLAFLLAVLFRYLPTVLNVLLLLYAVAILAVLLNAAVRLAPFGRRWATLLLGFLLLGGIAAVFWFGFPALLSQIRSLSAKAPALDAQLQSIEAWLRQVTGLNVKLVGPRAEEVIRNLFLTTAGAGDILSQARGLLELVLVPLLVLFGALFAVGKPNERLLTPFLRLFRAETRPAVRRVLDRLAERILGWLRGVLIGMLAVGLLSYLLYSLIGVPNALLLGVIAGLTEFVPVVGPWVGGGIATGIAFLHEPRLGLWTGLAALGIQQFENNVIVPWAMSRTADLHPLVTLFAVVLFGQLFGLPGVLMSIPLVLLFATLVEVFWVERAINTRSDAIEPVVRE